MKKENNSILNGSYQLKCTKQKSIFKKYFKNQRGVALIVLMSFVVMMGPLVLYLMDHSLQSHKVTMNSVRRLQSQYLAKSALNFSQLILYYNKIIQSRIQSSGANPNQVGALSEPLYKIVPLDTEMFKAIVGPTSATTGSDDSEQQEELEDGVDEASSEESGGGLGGLNAFQREKMNEFLSFSGNFSSFITEENAKYPVNAISKIETSHPSYDLHKRILLSLLMSPELEKAFSDQERDAPDLVHAIGDYIDTNTTINEFNQIERGYENSLYEGEVRPKSKNEKR